MFGISSLVVFLANWVPESLQDWDILEINANFVGVHRMLSIINAQGTAERTAGALLRVGELSSVKGNGKLCCSVLVLSNLIFVWLFLFFSVYILSTLL